LRFPSVIALLFTGGGASDLGGMEVGRGSDNTGNFFDELDDDVLSLILYRLSLPFPYPPPSFNSVL